MKINPLIPLSGAVFGYAAVALMKKDWKSPMAFVGAGVGAVLFSAGGIYFVVPKTADEVIKADEKKAAEIKAAEEKAEAVKPVEVKKELTQAEADDLVKKIVFEKSKRYIKAPNPNPIVALMKALNDGGWTMSNDKAMKLTAGNRIVMGGVKMPATIGGMDLTQKPESMMK